MLETDASDGVVVAILSQLHPDGEWYPVGYFSKTMAPTELNYPIHDKEMLAIVRALGQWRAELTGTSTAIKVLTDHHSLEYFMTSKILNSRQARWAEILADFFFVITYRPGKQNAKADALTRRDDDVKTSDQVKEKERTQTLLPSDCLDWKIRNHLQISALDAPFGLVDQILQANRSRRQLESETDHLSRGQVGWEDKDGLLLYDGRLVVPDVDNLRTKLVAEAHNQVSTAHPGRNKTLALLARKYYWKGMRAWVEQFVANCQACKRALPPRDKKHGFLHPLPIPDRPWQHVTHDFKSFPKDKHGYDMVYVVIDRLSKQSVCIPCTKNTTAKDMARMYITYIYRWRGLPESMVSDRGPQFVSQFWDEFCAILGIKVKLSTAYHPQTDGQTEIMNQYLDQRLRPFVNHYQDNWSDLLPMMDHAQLTLPHDSIGMSPFELNYGYQARTSFDWDASKAPATSSEKVNRQQAQQYATLLRDTWEVAKAHMEKAQAKQKRAADSHRKGDDLEVGDYVYVSTKNWSTDRPSRKLASQMEGPFLILAKDGNSYKVQLPHTMKIHNVFSPEKLLKAAMNPLPGQINIPPPPLQVTEDEEWEVEHLLAVRLLHGKLEYRAQWLGFDVDLDWYPASNFKYAPDKLREFHLANPARDGPLMLLEEWTKAWKDGRDDYDELEDDRPMTKDSRTSFFQKGGVM
jgi:transposase InsO family protein